MREGNERALLSMIREQLRHLPPQRIPHGYSVRTFRDGDEEIWENIMLESFGKYESFEEEMRIEKAFAPERIFFLCHKGEIVGSSAAMYRPEWGSNRGYLHFVAVIPRYSGKGLGLQISLRALLKMKEEGRAGAVLETEDFRLAAIKTYLKLGFEPLLLYPNQRKRWNQVFRALNLSESSMRFRDILE